MRFNLRALVIGALLTLAPQAFAQAFFPVNPLLQILPATITAQVSNPYYEPIYCEGVVFGQTLSGQILQGAMAQVVPPFQYRFVAVAVNNPYLDRFAHGWANVGCRFLRY